MKYWTPILCLLLLSALGIPLLAESSLTVNWAAQEIELLVNEEVPNFSPLARGRLQRRIEAEMEERFLEAAAELQLNSTTRLRGWIEENPQRLPFLIDRLEEIRSEESSYSTEFKTLSLRYRIPLFPTLGEIFIRHRQGYTLPPTLFHVPTAPYTGVVIYAQEELPVHGENREAGLVPALFPRIWDDSMQLIFEAPMMDREKILAGGCVGYATSLEDPAIENRVGPSPLRIAARGLFGLTPTDPIIPRGDALALLNSPDGRELLAEGRIVFIIPEQEAE